MQARLTIAPSSVLSVDVDIEIEQEQMSGDRHEIKRDVTQPERRAPVRPK